MTDGPDVTDLLAERSDLKPAVEAALEAEEASGEGPWTFDDIETDSGRFGELVSEGVVESSGDGYHLANPSVTRAALDGEVPSDSESGGSQSVTGFDFGISLPDIDRRVAGTVIASLLAVAVFRVLSFGAVFRDGYVVLSGNDPYYYRYWVDQIVTRSGIDFGLISSLPDAAATGEPLLIGLLSFVAAMLGGPAAVGNVLAWYPVVAAVLTACLVYLLAVYVTDDRRVAIAAVVFLAVVPAHAFRTSLGYADHHALDYLWLALTATSLAWLVCRDTEHSNRWPLLGAAGLSVGIAGQILSWEAGPLLVAPIAVIVALLALIDLRDDAVGLGRRLPLLSGLAGGAVLTWVGHLVFGWHTTVVTVTPTLLAVGAVGVLGAAQLAERFEWGARLLSLAEVAVAIAVFAVTWFLAPELVTQLVARLGRLAGSEQGIVETLSLLNLQATMLGVFLMGLVHFLALPVMAWAAWRVYRGDSRWVVPSAFAWYTFALSFFQVRFLGEFASFAALFGGFGFVWLAAWVDVTTPPSPSVDIGHWRPSRPSMHTAGAIFALFVLVAGIGVVQVPIKTNQVTIEDDTAATAIYLAEYAGEQNLADKDRYVLSNWGRNRVYNYFVSGDSESYLYAQQHYVDFLGSRGQTDWYDRFRNRVGFIVTSDAIQDAPPSTMYARLQNNLGSRGSQVDGLGHYRAVFVGGERSRVAFSVVRGAKLTGSGQSNGIVIASTEVDIPGERFTYSRQTRTDAGGNFTVRVAHPGEYTVSVNGQTRTVSVPESAVINGNAVTVDGNAG